MNFSYTLLYVKDVEATVKFYQNVFNFKLNFMTPEKDYAQLNTGETSLGFVSFELAESHGFNIQKDEEKPNFELAFTSKNINKDFQLALDNGAKKVTEISEKSWGQKVGYLKDLNGFLIEVCTPLPSEEIIYEVQIEINPNIREKFEDWLKEHIKEMLLIEGFINAKPFTDLKNLNLYRVQYTLTSMEIMNNYENNHAPRMRSLVFNTFNKDDLQFKRSIIKFMTHN